MSLKKQKIRMISCSKINKFLTKSLYYNYAAGLYNLFSWGHIWLNGDLHNDKNIYNRKHIKVLQNKNNGVKCVTPTVRNFSIDSNSKNVNNVTSMVMQLAPPDYNNSNNCNYINVSINDAEDAPVASMVMHQFEKLGPSRLPGSIPHSSFDILIIPKESKIKTFGWSASAFFEEDLNVNGNFKFQFNLKSAISFDIVSFPILFAESEQS